MYLDLRASIDVISYQGRPVFVDSGNDCVYQVIWKSKYGCPYTPPTTSCSIPIPPSSSSDYGKLIDLSPLHRSVQNGNNWELDHNGNKVLLNICGALVQGNGNMCPSDSSICLLSSNHPNAGGSTGTSLGSVGNVTVTEQGTVSLKFEDGDFCGSTSGSHTRSEGRRRSTLIHFTCRENSGEVSYQSSAYSCGVINGFQ
jgi:hypothetical protein